MRADKCGTSVSPCTSPLFPILLASWQEPSSPMEDNNFLRLAAPILNRVDNPDSHGAHAHFRRFFGGSALVVALAWELLSTHQLLSANAQPHHLLWACGFLRQYLREPVLVALFETTEKTIRRRMWPVILALAELTHIVVSSAAIVSSSFRCCRCRRLSLSSCASHPYFFAIRDDCLTFSFYTG